MTHVYFFLFVIAIPTDENTCEWIRTIYDAIQQKVNHAIDFETESKNLGISTNLLQYIVGLSKPPTVTARKLFQYVCVDELAKNTSWKNIPTSKIEAIHSILYKKYSKIK